MDWLRSGRTDSFTFQRIAWPSFDYVGDIACVTSCSITRSAGTGLKVSASLGVSERLAIGNDLVRIVSRSELGGVREDVVHATLFASCPSRDAYYGSSEGVVDLYSTLTVLEKKKVRSTLSIPAGTNAVDWAREAVESLGLRCTFAPSSARLNVAKTYERDTSYLAVVNGLLDFANYASADVNGYGGIVLKPYVDPSGRSAARTIRSDADGIAAPEFSIEEDYFDVPNVVSLVCSNEKGSCSATAEFSDPASPLSTANRFEVTYTEQIDDVASQAALEAKARSRLQDKLSFVERTTVRHPYLPDEVGSVWAVEYPQAGYSVRGTIYEQDIEMAPGMETRTTLRRFVDVG